MGKAADFDDTVAEKLLNEIEPTEAEVMHGIRKGTLNLYLTPVFMCSAYTTRGVQLFLYGVSY